jgi:hypothetical protein
MKIKYPTLLATVAATITAAVAAPNAFDWSTIHVMQNIPHGMWRLDFVAMPANPMFPNRSEKICASKQQIQEFLSSQFRGAPDDTSKCPSKIITNLGDKADIDIICPAVNTAFVSIPSLVVHYKIKQPVTTLHDRVFSITEGDKVMQTTATYLGKCDPR